MIPVQVLWDKQFDKHFVLALFLLIFFFFVFISKLNRTRPSSGRTNRGLLISFLLIFRQYTHTHTQFDLRSNERDTISVFSHANISSDAIFPN